jgi:transcription termination factor Rho
MDIILPTGKVPAQALSPRNLIIFSKPKTGKTTLLSQLDNCLILDLEQGSKYQLLISKL